MEKILGIIGGMGPAATIQFYKNITDKTPAKTDQEHIRMIILNHTSIPDRTEAILNGEIEIIHNMLLEDIKYLQKGGASAIAIPCNTAHYLIPKLEKETDIPIINMVTETAKQAKKTFKTGKIGVLGTDGTIKMGLYQKALQEQNLEPYQISSQSQKIIMDIIYKDIKAGKKGSIEEFKKVQNELEQQGCVGAILACTELSIFGEQEKLGKYYINAMSVLENRAIELMRG